MHRALWLLIGLQLRGRARAVGRSLRTVKGVLLVGVGLVFFVLWFMAIVSQRDGMSADKLLTYGPAYLLFYCLMNVLLSGGERTVYFSPAEVTFLFTGPFTRRQLLGYKVTLTLLFTLPTTLFLMAYTQVHASWSLAAFVGVLLMTTFMQLFGMALNLTAGSVGKRLYSRARQLVLFGVLLAAVLVFRSGRQQGVESMLHSDTWHLLSAPLRWFFNAFLAEHWLDLLRFGMLGLLVNFALLGVVFGLDADYLEAASAYSSRVYAQIQRLRGGPTIATGSDGPAPPPKPKRGLPMPPWLGGAGPLVWRQLTTALRSPGRLLGLVLMQALMTFVMLSNVGGGGPPFVMGIVIVMLSIFLSSVLPFDFRGDVDRLEMLKMLPLAPWRIALGQLLASALILSAFQWLMLAGLAVVQTVYVQTPNDALGEELKWLLAGAVVLPPFNFMLIGLENVLFVLSPSRQMAGTSGDFQAMGRNFLLMLAKMMLLLPVCFGAFLLGRGIFVLGGDHLLPAIAGAGIVLTMGAAALVPVAGLAFTWIDVSRDKPE